MTKRETYEQKTEALLAPLLDEHQFELVDVEFVKEAGTWFLRAYIDKPGGITIDDCELVSRALSDLLDEKDFIEETYEAVEAIDKNDTELLREELGDVLMQIVLHAQMEAEAGRFDFNDVCDRVCKKLIYRHPHVFGSAQVENSEQVLKSWDELKKKDKEFLNKVKKAKKENVSFCGNRRVLYNPQYNISTSVYTQKADTKVGTKLALISK